MNIEIKNQCIDYSKNFNFYPNFAIISIQFTIFY